VADLAQAQADGSLSLAACPGPPLLAPDFERAVRYRANAAGPPGSDQAAAASAELVEQVVALGSNLPGTAAGAQQRKCVFCALEVLCRSDAVGGAALQRAMTSLAAPSMPGMAPPLLLMRLVMEALRQRPVLAHFACQTLMPLLVSRGVWQEKERWQGFMLVAKKLLGPRPPHCLACLLLLPPAPLAQVLGVVPLAKAALAAFAASPEAPAALQQLRANHHLGQPQHQHQQHQHQQQQHGMMFGGPSGGPGGWQQQQQQQQQQQMVPGGLAPEVRALLGI
jgi:hypothetical protein